MAYGLVSSRRAPDELHPCVTSLLSTVEGVNYNVHISAFYSHCLNNVDIGMIEKDITWMDKVIQ